MVCLLQVSTIKNKQPSIIRETFFTNVARVESAHANYLRDGRRNVVSDGARGVLMVCMHVHLVVCISCVCGAARVCGSPGAHFGVPEVHFWSVGWPFLVVQVVIF